MVDFDSIYNDYSRLVYWTAYGVMRSQSDAFDVMQDVFIKVYSNIDKLAAFPEPQLKSWLYRVCKNACIDEKRKRRKEVITDEFSTEAVVNEYELPESAFENEELRKRVRDAIDELPEIYRECVLLHYFSGMQYEDIANMTGVSTGTIKSRISRAKDRLYAKLKDGEGNG